MMTAAEYAADHARRVADAADKEAYLLRKMDERVRRAQMLLDEGYADNVGLDSGHWLTLGNNGEGLMVWDSANTVVFWHTDAGEVARWLHEATSEPYIIL